MVSILELVLTISSMRLEVTLWNCHGASHLWVTFEKWIPSIGDQFSVKVSQAQRLKMRRRRGNGFAESVFVAPLCLMTLLTGNKIPYKVLYVCNSIVYDRNQVTVSVTYLHYLVYIFLCVGTDTLTTEVWKRTLYLDAVHIILQGKLLMGIDNKTVRG